MPIPTFDAMLDPLLRLAAAGPLTRRIADDAMAKHFQLTTDEMSARIPSGSSTVVRNRAGWAMTFLTKAGFIAKVAPKTYAATPRGLAALSQHPKGITLKDVRAVEGFKAAWNTAKRSKRKQHSENEQDEAKSSNATPIEALDTAMSTITAEVTARLLENILAQDAAFFERLVLDVVLALGYGGSREDAAEHLGKSNDEGIDGRINQDPLGLDQILLQAKRYAPDRPIDRQTIQAFVGAMTGQGVNKGVFITTSSFNDNALEFVKRGSQIKIVLIDGAELLDLMLRHHIGVRVERMLEVPAIDQNYFADDE